MTRKTKTTKSLEMRKYLLAISAGLFLVGTVFLTIEVGTEGAEAVRLEKNAAVLTEKNIELSDKIVAASSLSMIERKADEFGFVKPEKIFYLGKEGEIAKIP